SRRVGEHEWSKPGAIHCPGSLEHVGAEAGGDLRGRLGAGGGDAMRELVGGDDRNAALAKFRENVALAGCDGGSQGDAQHLINIFSLPAGPPPVLTLRPRSW